MEFKLTGLITPEMIQERYVSVMFTIDTPLLDAMKRADGGKTGITGYMVCAVKEYLPDLDVVLMAFVDEKMRKKESPTLCSNIKAPGNIADCLKQACGYLADKGYGKIHPGALLVACALLKADKERIIPAAE